MLVQLNCCSTRARARRAIVARKSGSSSRVLTAFARSFENCSGCLRLDFCGTQDLRRDEQPGRTVIDDLGNAAHGRSDDRRLACHRFQIDDSERLIYRRTHEDRGMCVQRDDLLFRQHLANPDDRMRALGARAVNRFCHLSSDVRCVRRTGTKDDLNARVEVPYRVDEMHDPLLAGNPADEQDIRDVWIDAKRSQTPTGQEWGDTARRSMPL